MFQAEKHSCMLDACDATDIIHSLTIFGIRKDRKLNAGENSSHSHLSDCIIQATDETSQ
jgi:hypothetical protein